MLIEPEAYFDDSARVPSRVNSEGQVIGLQRLVPTSVRKSPQTGSAFTGTLRAGGIPQHRQRSG